MQKVKFYELDMENKDIAVGQMLQLKKNKDYPNSSLWESEEELKNDLEQDYNPDEHFSFYVDEFNEVTTKIG